MTPDDLCELTLSEASLALREKRLSPVDLTNACLSRIENEDGKINAFTAVFADEAIDQARTAEQEIQRGQYRGPLHGIPIAVKDLIDVAGKVTAAGSNVLHDNVPTEDAEVVKRLRSAGAIILGKNNLHEFAYGGSGYISAFGPVRNPRDRARITGGSSSGSAAAVAAGFCFAAIGTDTAGSIRLPAACCGVVGLKPAFARVSARGVVPLSWSYDHVGPLTKTAEDASLVLQAIGDWRPSDIKVNELRVGVVREYFWDDVNSNVSAVIADAIEKLSRAVASVREVRVPIDEDRTVAGSESWQIHEHWVRENPDLYDPRTLARIRSGEKYTPEQIASKRQELQRIRTEAPTLFRDVDVILSPTSPILPPTFAELEADPEALRPLELLMLRNTRPWNIFGVPAISVPVSNMIGLQIAGRDEASILAVASVVVRRRES